jgi:threonine synthase
MYDGIVTAVSDKDALEGQVLLAKEGIFAQPAAAVSILAIKKLRSKGIINKKDKGVAIVTGSGLKYPGILNKHKFGSEICTLENLKEKIISIIEK